MNETTQQHTLVAFIAALLLAPLAALHAAETPHPNLAGYRVIADETAKFLAPIMRGRSRKLRPP